MILRALLGAAVLALGSAAAAAAAPLPPAAHGARIVVAFANGAHAPPPSAGTTGARYGGGGYRVTQDAHRRSQRIATTYRLRELSSWPIAMLEMHCVVYEIPDGRSSGEVLSRLAADPDVALAQPLNEFRTFIEAPAYNDPLYDLQTNLATLHVVQAHAGSQGAGVHVALIDTAVDAGHPDLAGRISAQHSYLAGGVSAGTRHGTAMAGIIGATANNHLGIVGIAPRATLEVFEACWQLAPDEDAAACNTFTLAQALAGALSSGARLVNLSIGGPPDRLLAALVAQGQRRGVVFVGARGTGDGFPASVAGVIVAAGEGATVSAPAEHVLTTLPRGAYDFRSGSSVAAAEVSGVVALLMSATRERLTAPDLVRLLTGPAADRDLDAAAALERLNAGNLRLAARPGS
ncbi:MAG: S8 family serine peptidase [Proteobacteria bacterium]|nr:S8 family serine peptidase [Pseudomonadota bacterium]